MKRVAANFIECNLYIREGRAHLSRGELLIRAFGIITESLRGGRGAKYGRLDESMKCIYCRRETKAPRCENTA